MNYVCLVDDRIHQYNPCIDCGCKTENDCRKAFQRNEKNKQLLHQALKNIKK